MGIFRKSGLHRKHRAQSRLLMALLIAADMGKRRALPADPRNILVSLYFTGLGDTLLLTPLLAALRARYPKARLTIVVPVAYLPLYEGLPYGARALPYSARDPADIVRLRRGGPYDLALIPGDTRQALLARAVGAAWVRAFRGGYWYYGLAVDEFIDYPRELEPISDLWAYLSGARFEGTYSKDDWPLPSEMTITVPKDFVVLHLGASSDARYWGSAQWACLAEYLEGKGFSIIITVGAGQESLIKAVDPLGRYMHYAGTLSLADMWHLLVRAKLLVVPDTGIAHLAKVTQTPTIVLFGQCDPVLYQPGRFWRGASYEAITVPDLACRDQEWFGTSAPPLLGLKRCMRSAHECPHALRCMADISVNDVRAAASRLLGIS